MTHLLMCTDLELLQFLCEMSEISHTRTQIGKIFRDYEISLIGASVRCFQRVDLMDRGRLWGCQPELNCEVGVCYTEMQIVVLWQLLSLLIRFLSSPLSNHRIFL